MLFAQFAVYSAYDGFALSPQDAVTCLIRRGWVVLYQLCEASIVVSAKAQSNVMETLRGMQYAVCKVSSSWACKPNDEISGKM